MFTFFRKYYAPAATDWASLLGAGATAAAGSNPWTMALMAVPGIISYFQGRAQKREGIDLARSNIRPVLSEAPQYEDMLQFFEKQAQYGLDSKSMSWQLDQSNRGLTRSLNAMLEAGGNPNNVADLYGSYADSIARTSAADSEMRWNKVNATANAMQNVIAAKEKEFLYNKDAPYKDTAQLAAQKQQAGQAAEFQGLDMIFGNTAKQMNENYQSQTFGDKFLAMLSGMYGTKTPATTTADNSVAPTSAFTNAFAMANLPRKAPSLPAFRPAATGNPSFSAADISNWPDELQKLYLGQ